jgi:putative RNA 2'-phosphotransferase
MSMDEKRLVTLSKYLSKHLRHQPERLGITLAAGGWVAVDELLAACRSHRFPITRAELDEVVARNNKQRFSFDATGAYIRANQGHSVEIDLHLEPVVPPATLYHGTGHRAVAAILREGLRKMNRHHVHLSSDTPTARMVGARHGRPALFAVDATAMHRDGYLFFCSTNGVWLVDHVPTMYLTLLGNEQESSHAENHEESHP